MRQLYEQASDLYDQDTHLVSCDEKTGIQALERKHPSKPMIPGKVALDEFECIRRRATSGFVEGVNNKIQTLKRRCYGIRRVRRIWLDLLGVRHFLSPPDVLSTP